MEQGRKYGSNWNCYCFLFENKIVQYFVQFFYSKTHQINNMSNLFCFGTRLYMFRTVFPSIIRSLGMYIQHEVYNIQVLWLLASKQPQNLYDIYLMLYVQS